VTDPSHQSQSSTLATKLGHTAFFAATQDAFAMDGTTTDCVFYQYGNDARFRLSPSSNDWLLLSRFIAKFRERFILPPDLFLEAPDIFEKPFAREAQKVKPELGILEI